MGGGAPKRATGPCLAYLVLTSRQLEESDFCHPHVNSLKGMSNLGSWITHSQGQPRMQANSQIMNLNSEILFNSLCSSWLCIMSQCQKDGHTCLPCLSG